MTMEDSKIEHEKIDTEKIQKSKILLVEDDANFGKVLKNYLELNDYVVELVRDGILGLAAFRREKYDLCLLDVMMPNLDGFSLAEEIRNVDIDIPLFFLTVKNMKEDILNGYRLGADDYILKPFDSDILIHKIKAILKRNSEREEKQNEIFEFVFGKFHFNSKLRELCIGATKYNLSPKENFLLKMLCESKNDLLPRDVVLKKIWGSDTYFNGRSMDVYIAKLRKILKDEILQDHLDSKRLKFIKGDQITVLEGPFQTFTGVINEIKGEKVEIDIKIFGRSTNVSLTLDQIQKS
jgi:DNA-binding response OmpR family regulator